MKATAVKFGIFTLVSLLFMALLFNTMANNVDGGTTDYQAEFTDVSGLRPGDDVRVAGVKVGRVQSIEVEGRHARVDFALSKEQPLLSTTQIVMRYQNLLGQRYLSLVQDGRKGTRLQEGATVPLDRTNPGFDLTALLNGFRPLFAVLEPEDVNRLSESVDQGAPGRGRQRGRAAPPDRRPHRLPRRPRGPLRPSRHEPHAGARQPRRARAPS